MRKTMKRTILAATVLSTVMANTLSVSAASVKDIFNAEYYATQYDDLKNAFGDDTNALYKHYLQYGLSEKRNASPILDVVKYRERYKDLDAAFGDDWNAYVNHYYTFGIKERRNSGSGFDPIAYAEKYPDIKAAFGNDYAAIINHYLTFGIAEGRTCDIEEQSTSDSVSSSDNSSESNSSESNTSNTETKPGQLTFRNYSENGHSFSELSMSARVNDNKTLDEIMNSYSSDISAVDSKGNSYNVSVTWNCKNFDSNAVGIYWVVGTVSPAEGTTVPFELPDILCALQLTSSEEGFYGYYIFEELYDTTRAVKFIDQSLATTVYKGSDWSIALSKLAVDAKIYALDKNAVLRNVDILWSCENFDGNTPGTYTATGTVTCDAFSTDLPAVTATITVANEEQDSSNLEFYKFAWDENGTSWLPALESGDGYYVTLRRAQGQEEIPFLPMYLQGKDSVTGQVETYEIVITFDATDYDCNALGTQILPAAEIKSTTPGFVIPFELPKLVVIVTVS